jgi:CRP-like cAMP-binding protein
VFNVFIKYIKDHVSISDKELDTIISVSSIKSLRRRQYLLQEGDVWKLIAFVVKGCLRTYTVDARGIEHINSFATENWWAGDRESLLTGKPSIYNIDAIEDSEILLITHDNYNMLCREIPAFNQMVTDIHNKSFISAQKRIHVAISYTSEQKYAAFIETYPQLVNRIPLHMIASFLGITPETLSRMRKTTAKNNSSPTDTYS